MAVVQRGESEAVVDGIRYRLVIDHAALAHAEWAGGVKINELLAALTDPDGVQTLAIGALIYGALRAHHRQMSLDASLRLVEAGGEDLGAALAEAMAGAFPDAAGKVAENPPPPPPGTGTISS